MTNNNDNGQVFGGVFLLTLGGLFLYNNYYQINFESWAVVSYWPVLLIIFGFLMIFGRVISLLVSIAAGIILAMFLFSVITGGSRIFSNVKIRNSSKANSGLQIQNLDYIRQDKVKLKLDYGATALSLTGGSSKLIELEGSKDNADYILKSEVFDGIQNISISPENEGMHICMFCADGGDLKVKLNENPIWFIEVDSGATSSDIDMSNLKVEQIDIDSGASKLNLKVGNKVVKTTIAIDSGASSQTIKVPNDSGVEIKTEGLIGKDLPGFAKIQNGLYRSENFDNKINKIYINAQGLSSLEVIKY